MTATQTQQPDPTIVLLQLFDGALAPPSVEQALKNAASYGASGVQERWAAAAIQLGLLRELRGLREQSVQLHNVLVQGMNGILDNQKKMAEALAATAAAVEALDASGKRQHRDLGAAIKKTADMVHGHGRAVRQGIESLTEELAEGLAALDAPGAQARSLEGGDGGDGAPTEGGSVAGDIIEEFEDEDDDNVDGVDAEPALPDELEEIVEDESEEAA
jgi:hypothetical protein